MTLHTYNPQLKSLLSINFLHLTVSKIWSGQTYKLKVTMARSKVKSRSHDDAAHLHPINIVPTPSINFLNLTVSEIQPGHFPIGKNSTPTAFVGCWVKTCKKINLRLPWDNNYPKCEVPYVFYECIPCVLFYTDSVLFVLLWMLKNMFSNAEITVTECVCQYKNTPEHSLLLPKTKVKHEYIRSTKPYRRLPSLCFPTEFIIIDDKSIWDDFNPFFLSHCWTKTTPTNKVRKLGVIFSKDNSFSCHITSVGKSWFYHIQGLATSLKGSGFHHCSQSIKCTSQMQTKSLQLSLYHGVGQSKITDSSKSHYF